MASGIEWFPLETNLLTDDEKVFDLMDGGLGTEAFADFGRFIALLERIYREGPALAVNSRMERRIAHDLGLDAAGFSAFVGRCVAAGLFHAGMWERHRVLTSRGIQLRWVKAKARARSQGLPADMRQWSLLDEPDEEPETPQAQCSPLKKLTEPENVPLDKTRQEEIRLDEIREEKTEDQSVCLAGEEAEAGGPEPSQDLERDLPSLVPPCMARENDGSVYLDGDEVPYRTPYGALAARYEARTGRRDFADFMAKVHSMCPVGCRASPRDVSECHSLVAGAIDNADPAKGTPWALTRHVLANDRGPRNA